MRSIKEALVVAQGHLSLQLAEGLKSDTDNDQERGATECKIGDTHAVDCCPNSVDDQGSARQDAQEESAQEGDAVQDLLDIIDRGLMRITIS